VRFLKAFGAFWYDFVIGDDWKVAGAVVAALVLTLLVGAAGGLSDTAIALLGGVLVVLGFTVSLLVDVRRWGRR
jgi:hypothetical protein